MFCKKVSCMLVVARDAEFLLALADTVEQSGPLRLAAAVSVGPAAVLMMGQKAPDVVVWDLALPDMPVLDAIRHMALQHPETDIVVLSDPGNVAQAMACMLAGARGHLDKNAAMEGLVAHIQALRAVAAPKHASTTHRLLEGLAGYGFRISNWLSAKPCCTLELPAQSRWHRAPGRGHRATTAELN